MIIWGLHQFLTAKLRSSNAKTSVDILKLAIKEGDAGITIRLIPTHKTGIAGVKNELKCWLIGIFDAECTGATNLGVCRAEYLEKVSLHTIDNIIRCMKGCTSAGDARIIEHIELQGPVDCWCTLEVAGSGGSKSSRSKREK